MIPITRKELYLNKIVGNDDYDIPEKPITTEEFFFAEILGEAVQAPEPLPRYQIYLAKIAGKNVEIPYPETRLEYFLARAAGMDVETPTPITREEIFWSNYSAIVEFEVEGVPPLTYKAIEGTLENYRIYGNTVGGESVGDRTGNLFDGIQPVTNNTTDTRDYLRVWFRAAKEDNPRESIALGDSVDLNSITTITRTFTMPSGYNRLYIKHNGAARDISLIDIILEIGKTYTISFKVDGHNPSIVDGVEITNIMLNSGSSSLPYEPYGYKVPVTINDVTTNLYLPEPIKMVGDEAEYIDYAEQKQHRIRKNLLQNTATSQKNNGVTFTVNSDGSVTCNGTASATASILLQAQITLNSGSYILTGCPQGGGVNTNYKLDIIDPIASVAVAVDTGSGASLTLRQNMQARIVIYTGQVLNNLTFYPMIRKADIEDDTYEPYIESTEVDVTLPELPTLKGTNVLSVGTAVQPSKVYVKYKGERQ